VRLRDYDPDADGGYDKSDPAVRRKLHEDLESMSELQERLYAEGKQALLIVLQAMDAGGKDGTIKHVMGGLNPSSCRVAGFKVPTPEELAHDFLWRIHKKVPKKGEIVVFNRSHYEDVIVVRVKRLASPNVWKKRYERINDFEQGLVESGTRLLKFFLHISKREQKERLQARIDEPKKHWKLNEGDFRERRRWNSYMKAYEDALTKCSTKHAPWHVIPANRKWYRNLVVADIIEKKLREMNPKWPKPDCDVEKLVLD
jgi:PPK2 family polyphosphate:nucleotide phosphotransferase